MKAKKLEKKLTLNKETISDLTHDQLNSVRGGTQFTKIIIICNTRTIFCTCDCFV